MIEMGLIVGIGLLLSLSKMTWRWRLWVLSHPVLIDWIILAALLMLHWGTFSGVMVATIGAAACNVTLTMGRMLFGYMENGEYVPGRINIAHKLVGAA